MTRAQALARISRRLEVADDETVLAVADIVEQFGTESVLPRELTQRELELIEQSREDFKAGRTLTPDEVRASLDDRLAVRGVPRSKARA